MCVCVYFRSPKKRWRRQLIKNEREKKTAIFIFNTTPTMPISVGSFHQIGIFINGVILKWYHLVNFLSFHLCAKQKEWIYIHMYAAVFHWIRTSERTNFHSKCSNNSSIYTIPAEHNCIIIITTIMMMVMMVIVNKNFSLRPHYSNLDTTFLVLMFRKKKLQKNLLINKVRATHNQRIPNLQLNKDKMNE